jgi:uncharacterized metal-binding protein
MPSGRTHLTIEAGILSACAAAGIVLVRKGSLPIESLLAFLGGYAFSMVFLTPDLDLVRSRPTRRWGRLSILWWPYAKLFRHRGVSHHMVWGPLTRIAYLTLLATAAAVGIGAVLGRPVSFAGAHANVWAILAGVYVPNVAHTVADAVATPHHRRT